MSLCFNWRRFAKLAMIIYTKYVTRKKLVDMSAVEKPVPLYPIVNTKPSVAEDNYLTGYVKLFRSIENKSWYKKSEFVHLWIHLFIKATRIEREDWFHGNPVKIKPGQLITGRKKLSRETGIEESKIERILKCFISEQQIEQQTSNISRLISIKNWHLYQNVEQQSKQRVNNKRTTGEQRVNTIQEGKEYRESKEGSVSVFFENEILANASHELCNKYKALVDFILGNSENGIRMDNVLSLPKQISFKNYLTLRKTYDQNQKRSIRDVLESMEGKKDLKQKYESVFWVVNNWLKNDFEKK
jgi:hypothetical protein